MARPAEILSVQAGVITRDADGGSVTSRDRFHRTERFNAHTSRDCSVLRWIASLDRDSSHCAELRSGCECRVGCIFRVYFSGQISTFGLLFVVARRKGYIGQWTTLKK